MDERIQMLLVFRLVWAQGTMYEAHIGTTWRIQLMICVR